MARKAQLIIPVRADQIEAASDFHEQLRFWKSADTALEELHAKFSEYGLIECLITAAAVNQFYRTNVYWLLEQAECIEKVFAASEIPKGPALVEALAQVTYEDGSTRRNISFASKFAHFFIDEETYPICDRYVVKRLRHHLPAWKLSLVPLPQYADFISALGALRVSSNLESSGRALDRYLWLGGLYCEWKQNHKAKINVEAKKLFLRASADEKLRKRLQLLC